MNERIGYPDFIKNESKLNEKYEKVRKCVTCLRQLQYILHNENSRCALVGLIKSVGTSKLKKIPKKYFIQNYLER